MKHFNDDEYIYLSLLHLGAVEWSKSSNRLLCTLQYVVSHYEITAAPMKCLYNKLASPLDCTYSVLERSLRYAIRQLWECSGAECSKLLYHSAEALTCPTVSEFIFLYANAYKRGIIQAWVDSLEADAAKATETDMREILELFKL